MRKFWLGMAFMCVAGFIAYTAVHSEHQVDLTGVALIIGAIASGVLSVVWGNSQEWKAKQNVKSEEKTSTAGTP